MQIAGKVVLITGASEGIGAACARVFRDRGAELALVARRKEKLDAIAPGHALVAPADVTDPEQRRRAVGATLDRYGRIDILINNAGAGLYQPAHRADLDAAHALFDLNFFAPLGMTQLVAPAMKRQKSGYIVNVSSIAGKVALPWLTLYSASKYALGAFTEGLGMELHRDGIQTMTVCPGYVSTRFQQNILAGDVPEPVRAGNWLRITAEECADAIARGVERDARTVVTPTTGWLFVLAARLLPGRLQSSLRQIYERGTPQ